MAKLNNARRINVWAELQRKFSEIGEPFAATKDELRTLVNTTDDWVDDMGATFNAAIPVGIRNKFTAKQKAATFMAVAEERFENS